LAAILALYCDFALALSVSSCCVEGCFTLFRETVMASVSSTAHPRGYAPAQYGKNVITDRGAIDEVHDSAGFVERTESAHASDMGS
jgi:hypothetical protein